MKHKRNYRSIKENIYELLRRQRDKQLFEDHPQLSDPLPNQTGGVQSKLQEGAGSIQRCCSPGRVKGSSWPLLQLF